VFEIMGINPNDKRYSAHHIIFRSDFERPNHFPPGYCNSKANLFPLTIEEHERLHKKVMSFIVISGKEEESTREGSIYLKIMIDKKTKR
jgi:hypothetical protein